MPDRLFSPSALFYQEHGFEKGGFLYDKLLRVRKWKDLLPVGGPILKSGFRKRTIQDFSRSSLERYLTESCRAEFSHWLAIFPFWIFALLAPWKIFLFMLLYTLVVNLPCIVIQRYNRPRIIRLLEKLP